MLRLDISSAKSKSLKRGEEGRRRRAVAARKQALMEVAEAGSGNAQRQQRRSAKLKMERECRMREAIQIYYDDEESRLKKKNDDLLRREQRLEEKISDMPFINWCCLDFFLGVRKAADARKQAQIEVAEARNAAKEEVRKAADACKQVQIEVAEARNADAAKEEARKAADARKQAQIEIEMAEARKAAQEAQTEAAAAKKAKEVEASQAAEALQTTQIEVAETREEARNSSGSA